MPEELAIATDTQPNADPQANGTQTGTPGATPATNPAQTGQSVEQLQAEVQKERQRYDELRSFEDRRYNQLQQTLAEMKAQLGLQAERGQPAPDQEEFEKAIEEEINENPGRGTKKFVRGVAAEMMAQLKADMAKQAELMRSSLVEVDPDFKANRETVERIERDYGLSRDKAVKLAKELASASPSNPPNTPPPGRVTNARGTTTAAEPHTEKVVFGDGELQGLKYLGLDPTVIAAAIVKESRQ